MQPSPETLDIVAALLSVAGTSAGSARLKISWPLSFVACFIYCVLFLQKNLIFNALIHFVYMPLSISGLYLWQKKPSSTPDVQSAPTPVLSLIIATCLMVFFYCKIHNLSFYFDFITSFLSISAFILMGFAQLECWLLWLVADTFYLQLYSAHALPFSLLKSIIYFFIATWSFLLWKKQYKTLAQDEHIH